MLKLGALVRESQDLATTFSTNLVNAAAPCADSDAKQSKFLCLNLIHQRLIE